MNKILVAFAVAILAVGQTAVGQTAVSEKTSVMSCVNQFLDAFNKGDAKAAEAVCADQMSIIDEFPPHEWHGAGACSIWFNAYDVDAKKNGITDGIVTFSNPRHVDITADRAYVVVPADYTFKKKGKQVKETGSMFTVALHKGEGGWRITGWAWTKR
jgi:ketosteroid isomerase-like protein